VVDDDSPDGTGAVVSAIAQRTRGCGSWSAKASARSPAQFFTAGSGPMHPSGRNDADGQHPPEVLPQLIERIYAGRDMVIGSRYRRVADGRWTR